MHQNNYAIGRKAVLDAELIYSDAFADLTKSSIRVLIRFLQKREFHNEGKGKNKRIIYHNDPIVFTYHEAKCYGISRSSFHKAIGELFEKGFIEIVHQGGSIGNGKDWSRYKLIEDWKKYGTPEFKKRTKTKSVQYSDALKIYNHQRSAGKKSNHPIQ